MFVHLRELLSPAKTQQGDSIATANTKTANVCVRGGGGGVGVGGLQPASKATQQGKVFRRLSRMSLQILPFIVLSQCRALSVAISDCQCADLARRDFVPV